MASSINTHRLAWSVSRELGCLKANGGLSKVVQRLFHNMSGSVLLIVVIIFYDEGGRTSLKWPNSCHYPSMTTFMLS